MPKPIKKRVKKKIGLEEEEVKSRALETIRLLQQKRKVLIYVVVVFGILSILAASMIIYSSYLKKRAYDLELEGYRYYYNLNLTSPMSDEQRWKKSLELFQKAVNIKSTPVAMFYIGNCYFKLGDYNNAIKEYNRFIDEYRDNEEILPLVYQKLASAYIKIGKDDDALKTLSSLAQFKKGAFRDTALILQARYYESKGEIEEAQKRYEELVRDFPLSPWGLEARRKLEVKVSEESSGTEDVKALP
jgi:lipopolysaccharide biosynthesis regulator YciM